MQPNQQPNSQQNEIQDIASAADQATQVQIAPPVKQKRSKKPLFVILLVLLLLAAVGFGGWMLMNKQQDYEDQLSERDAKIASLEKKLQDSAEDDNGTEIDEADTLTAQDIKALDTALTATCNVNPEDGKFTYLVSDADGKEFSKISLDTFKKVGANNTPKYAKGFVIVAISCKSVDKPEEGGGGFVSILQGQSDGTWLHILGFQDTPTCINVNARKIPKEILAECLSTEGPTPKVVPNTN